MGVVCAAIGWGSDGSVCVCICLETIAKKRADVTDELAAIENRYKLSAKDDNGFKNGAVAADQNDAVRSAKHDRRSPHEDDEDDEEEEDEEEDGVEVDVDDVDVAADEEGPVSSQAKVEDDNGNTTSRDADEVQLASGEDTHDDDVKIASVALVKRELADNVVRYAIADGIDAKISVGGQAGEIGDEMDEDVAGGKKEEEEEEEDGEVEDNHSMSE